MPVIAFPRILPPSTDARLEFIKYANLLVSLRERRQRARALSSHPFEVTVDLTTVCQLSCPYCEVGNGTMQRTKGVLGPVVHRRMMSELADRLFVIWYFSTGEPLLNKRLPEIVRENQGKEIFSVISTNLSLPLSDEKLDELLTCGLGCISVSCDGATNQTYDRYRVGGDFDLVTKNMRRLVERKRALGLEMPLIEWRFLVFKHNQHEVEAVRKLAAEWGVDLVEIFRGVAPEAAGPTEVQLADPQIMIGAGAEGPAVESARARRDTALHRALSSHDEREVAPPESAMGRKCDWLYFGSMLYPNESVGPCCVSNQETDDFGSLAESGRFAEVWNNERFQRARRMFDEPTAAADLVCSRCPMPSSQDYQFRNTLRGLLRNAPDWFLTLLQADLAEYLYEADMSLLIDEVEFLTKRYAPVPEAVVTAQRSLEAHREQRPDDPLLARAGELLAAYASPRGIGRRALDSLRRMASR